MSITDELRKRIDFESLSLSTRRELWNIADRIDAEHERATAGCIHYDPERHYCAAHGDTENGWVRLPVDADGEYIRVGDAVTCGATVWTVTGLKFLGEGWSICCTVYNKYGGSGTTFYPPSDLRHYHAPTVEDILREFALRAIRESEGNYGDLDETCAEYAKRLRLAGDGEEQ